MDKRLINLEIPEPNAAADLLDGKPPLPADSPSKDIPNGKGIKLDDGLIKSSNSPEDVNKALELQPKSDIVSSDKS